MNNNQNSDKIEAGLADKGFDKFLKRDIREKKKDVFDYISGADFDAQLDDIMFSRMIKFRDLREQPQGNDPAKTYWDGKNKKLKMWVDATGKWVDVIYTSTSTSTSSTSSSSSSSSSSSTSTT